MILREIARCVFKLKGWKVDGQLPPHPMKFLLLIGPHTCDMDVVLSLGAAVDEKVPLKLLVTHDAFNGIQGPILKMLGAIPVNKNAKGGMVGQVAKMFEEHEAFVMALAPEGSKFKTQRLRTGFWHIARQANVPLQLVAWDYDRKAFMIGPLIEATDDMEHDLRFIWDYYKNNGVPRHPHRGVSGELELPPMIKPKPSEKKVEEPVKTELSSQG
ncbi:MAG: 1-acyl-sn-glycerol-3-phosphate acyltransferase [Flavobacteriales bacterium]|nr:1-acyl-sn-glycerol-3-phosphate acyltransferase [Flavobacteriales bacterium]